MTTGERITLIGFSIGMFCTMCGITAYGHLNWPCVAWCAGGVLLGAVLVVVGQVVE